MIGSRVEPVFLEGGGFQPLNPGEFAFVRGHWHGCTPNGHACNLTSHSVTEHDDGTITVSPSILVSYVRNDGGAAKELWHGWLRNGVWEAC